MSRDLEHIRNIGIIAHIDAGKTTVTERMLYYSGTTHRVGAVDKGTAETDFDEEEQQRGITIYSACVTFQWNKMAINLLDTPGHVDFTSEVERCLRVLDGGVVVFSAREGVEAQSETVWRQANKYHVPRIVFINKMDRDGANFERTLNDIGDRLGASTLAIQIPVGQGPPHIKDAFRGIIDLINMKLLDFVGETEGKEVAVRDIPDECRDDAEHWREVMLEQLYNYSDDLMELALQEEPAPAQLIREVLREATLSQHLQPVLCGSALDGIGVQPLLDAVTQYLPSPTDMPPVEGTNPKKKKETVERRKPLATEPFCGLVFKVIPAKTGDFSWVRVYSGQLKSNSRLYNPAKDKKENVAQLWRIHASRREQVEQATTGDIVGLIGLRHSITGDTLCDSQHPILLETIEFPETVLSMAIEPETTAERKKLGDILELMRRQDPTFRASKNEETGQTLISGMGELHLEVIKHRLLRDFNLNVKVHRPRISYRESIEQAVDVVGECHRHVAGQQLFAKLNLRMEPSKNAAHVIVINGCPPDMIPDDLRDAALDEVQARAERGGRIGGFPLMQMKVTVTGGEAQLESSTEIAFRIAAADAFEEGLQRAGPALLEPIMRLEIATPEEYLGDFVGDLQQRRSVIVATENRGTLSTISAETPLAELFGYSSSMRSLSQGRAGCSMEPLKYESAPSEIAKQFAI